MCTWLAAQDCNITPTPWLSPAHRRCLRAVLEELAGAGTKPALQVIVPPTLQGFYFPKLTTEQKMGNFCVDLQFSS